MKALMVFLFSFVVSGCFMQSDVPVRAETGPSFDQRLVGVWEGSDENGAVYLHIGSSDSDGKVVVVEHSSNGEVSSEEYAIVAACIHGGCYLSIRLDEKDDSGFAILKYVLTGTDLMTIQYPRDDFMKTAFASGLIQGKYTSGLFQRYDVHATEVELREFLARYGEMAFADGPMTLRKIPAGARSTIQKATPNNSLQADPP